MRNLSAPLAAIAIALCTLLLHGCGSGEDSSSATAAMPQAAPASRAMAVAQGSSAVEQEVSQLYVALFGRAPDTEGLNYWAGRRNAGQTMAQVADAMYGVAPARAYYPSGLAPREVVASFYRNVLGREADQGGLDYWTAKLTAKGATEGSLIAEMIGVVANYTGNVPEGIKSARLFTNRVLVAVYYAQKVGAIGSNADQILINISENQSSVTLAYSQIDGWKAMSWSLTEILDAGEINLNDYLHSSGHYDLLAAGDLNGDGNDDLLLAPKVWDTLTQYDPIIIAFYNPTSGKFSVDKNLQITMPTIQWGHKAKIADFNLDGYNDVLIIGTGPDQGQPCGEASILLLGSKTGLVNASNFLPRFSAYTHQMAIGDFNGDKKLDFIFLNNQWIPTSDQDPKIKDCGYRKYPGTNQSFIVLSNSNGWSNSPLQVDSDSGPIISQTGGLSYSSAFAGDFDGDGNEDIVIGGGNFGSLAYSNVLLTGDGKGGFRYHSRFTAKPFGENTVASGLTGKDVDNDGQLDLILNFVKHIGASMPWQGSIYKVYKLNQTDKTWTEITSEYFPADYNLADADLTYCDAFYWIDLNNDNQEDLVCSIMAEYKNNDILLTNPRIWLKTPKNTKIDGRYFLPTFHKNISVQNKLADLTPVKINNNIYLAGISERGQNSILKLQLVR